MASWFPVGLCWAQGDPRTFDGPWLPEEAECVARAIPKRKREFGLGRALARQVARELGHALGPMPPGSDRRPPWPSELRMSIAHCEDLCVVLGARSEAFVTIGVDVEPVGVSMTGLIEHVTTASERARWTRDLNPEAWAAATFVAKEAFYKAQFELTERVLEFDDVRCVFDAPPGPHKVSFTCTPHRGPALSGEIVRTEGHWMGWSAPRASQMDASPSR